MKIQGALLAAVLLVSGQAFASNDSVDVQGPDVQALNPSDFSSVCLIQVFQPATKQGFLCTGSVISSNSVLTAAHCTLKDPAQAATAQVNMMCGSQIIRQYPYKNLNVTKPEDQYWTQVGTQDLPTFSKDLAVIRFSNQTLNATPIPVAYNGAKYFGSANQGQMTGNLECLLIGYGRNGSSAGKLFASPVKDSLHYAPAYDSTPMVVLISKSQGSLVRNSIDHGDSGGPLLCRQPGGSYQIFGINQSGDGGLETFEGAHYNAFTSVFNSYSSNLIQKGLGKALLK